VLEAHVVTLHREQAQFGPDYRDHGVLSCWEDGSRRTRDTVTRRFRRLAWAAGLPVSICIDPVLGQADSKCGK
jgi:hypothetical protein